MNHYYNMARYRQNKLERTTNIFRLAELQRGGKEMQLMASGDKDLPPLHYPSSAHK